MFADGPASPLYNVHGQYITSFEQQSGVALSWLGNPGTYHLGASGVTHGLMFLVFYSNRRGYVTESRLKVPGDPSGGVVYEASDNDGLWTSMYLGAKCFEYAATKDPEAKKVLADVCKKNGVTLQLVQNLLEVQRSYSGTGRAVGISENCSARRLNARKQDLSSRARRPSWARACSWSTTIR